MKKKGEESGAHDASAISENIDWHYSDHRNFVNRKGGYFDYFFFVFCILV